MSQLHLLNTLDDYRRYTLKKYYEYNFGKDSDFILITNNDKVKEAYKKMIKTISVQPENEIK